MKKIRNRGMSKKGIAALGVGAAAIGGAAYYFLGPKGEKHQKSAKKWTMDAKKKIAQKLEKAKDMTESIYEDIVDDVVKPYAKKGAATAKEVGVFAETLKKDWKHVVTAVKKQAKK